MKTQHSRTNSFSLQRKTRNVRRKKENNAKVRYLSIHILFERKKIALSILFNTTGYIYIYFLQVFCEDSTDIEKAQPWHHAPLALQSSLASNDKTTSDLNSSLD